MSNQQSQAQKHKEPIHCRGCDQEIKFHKDHRGPQGGWIPMNTDMTVHNCPNKPKQPAQQPPAAQPQVSVQDSATTTSRKETDIDTAIVLLRKVLSLLEQQQGK